MLSVSLVPLPQATGLDGRVDPSRLALWGVSFSGGHVLSLAAQLGDNVTAVVANEPHLTSSIEMVKGTLTRGVLPVGGLRAGTEPAV